MAISEAKRLQLANARARRAELGSRLGRKVGDRNKSTLLKEEVEKEFFARALAQVNSVLIKSFVKAAKKGDWRAADALMDRLFGKPTERHEIVAAISLVELAKHAETIETDARAARVIDHVDIPVPGNAGAQNASQ